MRRLLAVLLITIIIMTVVFSFPYSSQPGKENEELIEIAKKLYSKAYEIAMAYNLTKIIKSLENIKAEIDSLDLAEDDARTREKLLNIIAELKDIIKEEYEKVTVKTESLETTGYSQLIDELKRIAKKSNITSALTLLNEAKIAMKNGNYKKAKKLTSDAFKEIKKIAAEKTSEKAIKLTKTKLDEAEEDITKSGVKGIENAIAKIQATISHLEKVAEHLRETNASESAIEAINSAMVHLEYYVVAHLEEVKGRVSTKKAAQEYLKEVFSKSLPENKEEVIREVEETLNRVGELINEIAQGGEVPVNLAREYEKINEEYEKAIEDGNLVKLRNVLKRLIRLQYRLEEVLSTPAGEKGKASGEENIEALIEDLKDKLQIAKDAKTSLEEVISDLTGKEKGKAKQLLNRVNSLINQAERVIERYENGLKISIEEVEALIADIEKCIKEINDFINSL